MTTGIIWAQVRKFERFGACVLYLCSYNLVGSVTTGIGAEFNIKHIVRVFENKSVCLRKVLKI
jgi:hypothetical protein